MKRTNPKSFVERCNNLTKNGERLAITWDGGHDDGFFQLKLDDNIICDDDTDPLIQLIADKLHYGSFAGEFSTQGELVYNRKKKCFEGTDTYTESVNHTRNCAIEVRVPKDLWFDQITICIETNGSEAPDIFVEAIIVNGPRIKAHEKLEKQLCEQISQQIAKDMEDIEDLCDVGDEITINHRDMVTEEKSLLFIVKGYQYSSYASEDKNIAISLTGKN